MTIQAPLRDAAPNLRRLGRQHPLLPIWLGVVLYSTGPVFVAASSVSGPVFSFWRLWFGVAVLAGAAGVDARRRGGLPTLAAWRWSLAAGIAFGAHQLLMFTAIKATTVADVTLVNSIAPILTAVLAAPLFHERPGVAFRLWSLVAMAGAAIVVFGGSTGPDGDPVGMLLALANVVAFAIFFLVSKSSRAHVPVLPFLFGVVAVASLFVSAYVAVAGEAAGSVGTTDLLYAVTVAVVPGFIGHLVSTWPLEWVPANVPPVMRLSLPVLAATWAWWFLGETVGWLHVMGGAVTLVGVAGALASPSARAFVGAGPESRAVLRLSREPSSG